MTVFVKKILLLFISVLIGLIFSEIGLRSLDIPKPVYSGWKGSPQIVNKELNQLGFRGQSISYSDSDFVVLLLGDSQVEAGYLSFDSIPEQILQRQLRKVNKNVKVFSIGGSGYGQDQELIALTKYFSMFRANIVLLWFTSCNDLWNNMFPTHWPNQNGAYKPTYILKNNTLEGPFQPDGSQVNSSIKLLALVQRYSLIHFGDRKWSKYLPPSSPPPFARNLNITQMSNSLNDLIEKKIGPYWGDSIEIEKSHLLIYTEPITKRIDYSIKLTKLLVKEIKFLCELNNSKFLPFFYENVEFNLLNKNYKRFCSYLIKDRYIKLSTDQFSKNINNIFNPIIYYKAFFETDSCFMINDNHLKKEYIDSLMFGLTNFMQGKVF